MLNPAKAVQSDATAAASNVSNSLLGQGVDQMPVLAEKSSENAGSMQYMHSSASSRSARQSLSVPTGQGAEAVSSLPSAT